jgi:hypothetical protein
VRPGARARLDAQAALQVAAVTDGPLPVPVARSLASSGGLPDLSSVAGCLRGTALAGAWFAVPAGTSGAQVRLSVRGLLIGTTLVLPGDRRSTPVRRRVTSDEPTWVGTSVPGSRLVVSVPPGPVEICLAGSQTSRP